MKAIWRGRVIGETTAARQVLGYWYFPRDSVRMELLNTTAKTAKDLECPHGVQFYDVGEGDVRSSRAAWSYEAPQSQMRQVDHWIGFWGDVEVTRE